MIMITGYATVESAVQAVKAGAEEYLSKPFTDQELFTAVRRTLDKLRNRKTTVFSLRAELSPLHGLLGESAAMHRVFGAIKKTSSTLATVLITGESGTGKELAARAIHYSSKRASAPFVPVNCGGIPEGLLESELFGYVKGAFTGAYESRAGFFQTAEGGTIFLDEISETSIGMQVKLLRVLQDKEVYMVGDTRPRNVDIRIIAATNKDLKTLVERNVFREDLYFRINVITIEMPPLRERENDILLLAKHFARKFAADLNKPEPQFTDDALRVLKNYYWPGNVRELENVIQRMVVMGEEKIIEVVDLPSLMRFSALRGTGLNRTLAEMEAEHIRNVLSNVDHNISRAAHILAIDRKTLREKMKRYHLTCSF
jgi:DNA-binding NtrC family response regulator